MKEKKRKKNYNYQSLRDEREYGFYWYSALWQTLRPMLIVICSLIIVIGIGISGWNVLYNKFLAPVDVKNTEEIVFEIEEGSSLTRVSNNLANQDLIRNKPVFKYFLDFMGLGQK
ncbi:MAG: hypothetical protein GX786_07190, partial [Clostridiales bacterium]|nr:hypothetical protein [Clostridiales bacterium]